MKQQVKTQSKAPAAPPAAAPETAVAVADKNTEVGFPIDFAADAGMGQEFGAGDLAIPFLVILQKNSPQVDETQGGKYLPDAKPGMIFNTVTGDLFDGRNDGIIVVPAGYQKMYVEWVPREQGGGFVAQHQPGADIIRASKTDERGKLVTPEGNQLVETAYHFVVLVDKQGNAQWGVMGMSSTQLKKSRKWNTLIAGQTMRRGDGTTFKPPIFAMTYRMKTVVEQKDQNTWYGWDVAPAGVVQDKNVYESAKAYHAAVQTGAARVTAPPSESNEPPAEGGDKPPF